MHAVVRRAGAVTSSYNFKRFSLIMECDNLLAAQGKLCVCLPLVIAEFNLISVTCENLNDSPDLATL